MSVALTFTFFDSCVFPNCISNLTVPPVKLRGIISWVFSKWKKELGPKKNFFFSLQSSEHYLIIAEIETEFHSFSFFV